MSKLVLPHSTWVMLMLMLMFVIATCDIEQDRKKCQDTLLGMATCLAFVSGEANVPPIDCCTGFNQVLAKSPDCICLLIKDRNDPSLGGLQINATRALSLPTRCKSHSNQTVADCPAILHLPPNSPDAKVFDDFAQSGTKSNATAPAASGNSSAATIGTKTRADHNSNGGRRKQTGFGNEMASVVLLAGAALVFLVH